MSTKPLVYKLRFGKGTQPQTFEGFSLFTGTRHSLAVQVDGEWEFYDWDGSHEGVQELERMYRLSMGEEPDQVIPFVNGFIAAEEERLSRGHEQTVAPDPGVINVKKPKLYKPKDEDKK